MSIRLLFSHSYNPWFNLSIEEYIFRNMPQSQSILFLWRNENTVVIGRAQNAWKECNTRRMKRDGIRLARRHSGGGAVFHDLGNTCFTFMSTQKNYDKNLSTNIIVKGLESLGIAVLISGRNDLIVRTKEGERKISGSAYREISERKFHHGTLLLHVNLNKLVYYLEPDSKKLQTKGISSIRSRVANLSELIPNINYEKICHALTESFFKFYKTRVQPEFLSMENFSHMPGFYDQLNKQRDWNWNFGNAPAFAHQLDTRFVWGGVTLHFDIKNGIITRSQIFTDSLNPEPLEELSENLVGISYCAQDIQKYCEKWIKNWPHQRQELLEVTDWLIKNLN